MKPYVGCDHYFPNGTADWSFVCEEHDEYLVAPTWESAYEAAMGHIVMKHGPSARKCRDCTFWTFRNSSWDTRWGTE